MSHEYPPLPEPDRTMWQYGNKKDLFTSNQMRAYAAPLLERIAELEGAMAAERERWRGLVQEALDADEGDYVLGKGLADKMRAALRA